MVASPSGQVQPCQDQPGSDEKCVRRGDPGDQQGQGDPEQDPVQRPSSAGGSVGVDHGASQQRSEVCATNDSRSPGL
ncbi:hypothetical protein SK854_35205 [Lentzea sp. BCCO 10_0061]|uniref:Uncharacterized protein n=1 Tax=Lentzea sokolovensis TaxID=3095429 RepID=A0ABU4V6I0_9PSEU|nr:hypothetical protein [Lentzea sp. BCCO 10_0061]MDX8147403.1 hypothetical protein [Lentzea sp. BCCO 10_0061]